MVPARELSTLMKQQLNDHLGDEPRGSADALRVRAHVPSVRSAIVSVLILVAAASLLALFVVPNGSGWGWAIAGVFALSSGLAMLIPLGKSTREAADTSDRSI